MYSTIMDEIAGRVFALLADKGIGLSRITNEDISKSWKSYWEDKIAVIWEFRMLALL